MCPSIMKQKHELLCIHYNSGNVITKDGNSPNSVYWSLPILGSIPNMTPAAFTVSVTERECH